MDLFNNLRGKYEKKVERAKTAKVKGLYQKLVVEIFYAIVRVYTSIYYTILNEFSDFGFSENFPMWVLKRQ